MHPATGLPLAQVVPKGGATLCGRFFPEGVRDSASSDEAIVKLATRVSAMKVWIISAMCFPFHEQYISLEL